MKKAIRVLVFSNMLFLLFLTASGFFSGAVSDIIYYLAFLCSAFFALFTLRGEYEPRSLVALPEKRDIIFTLLGIFPFIGITMLVSFLTTTLFSLFGLYATAPDVSGSTVAVLLTHAVVPALLEEFLFRLVPFTLLGGHSRRAAFLASSLLFALVHCNVFQIPYALVAGLLLGAVYVLSGSIIPSLILHLANNTVSVFWIRYGGVQSFRDIFVITVTSLAILSVILMIVLMKDRIRNIFSKLSTDKSKHWFTFEFLIFVLLTVFIAVSNMFSV